jgi:hypothetical protein
MSVQLTERQLRTFCLTYSVIFILFGLVAAALPFLIAQGAAAGEKTQPLLLAQQEICAVVLIFLAAVLLHVRSSTRSPRTGRTGRNARIATVVAALVVVAGLIAVVLTPLTGETAGGKFPAIAVSALTLLFGAFAYSGLSKLPSS